MSYGKCWYSEAPDPQSFLDVDHYRPKLEAKRSNEVKIMVMNGLHFHGRIFAIQRSDPTELVGMKKLK